MSDLETNKKNVVEFYDLIINKKDFESAQEIYGGPLHTAQSSSGGRP